MAFKSSVPDSSTGNGGGFVPVVRVGKRGVRVYMFIFIMENKQRVSLYRRFLFPFNQSLPILDL
jgi:hypothetical protein